MTEGKKKNTMEPQKMEIQPSINDHANVEGLALTHGLFEMCTQTNAGFIKH